jgi:hypothetical protein
MGRTFRLTGTRLCALFFIVLGSAVACGGGGDDGGGTTGSVWAPTTVPFDPTCKDCTKVGTVSIPHMGEVDVLRDSSVDDPVRQWARCVNGILDCIEETKDESGCVARSSCPGACKDDYAAHLKKLGRKDLETRWNALRAVFVSPTSRCTVESSPAIEVQP